MGYLKLRSLISAEMRCTDSENGIILDGVDMLLYLMPAVSDSNLTTRLSFVLFLIFRQYCLRSVLIRKIYKVSSMKNGFERADSEIQQARKCSLLVNSFSGKYS